MKRYFGWRKVILYSYIFLIIPSSVFGAGWIDDWVAQKSVYGSNSFEGQKRGYGSAGGASLRWRQSNDYLVSIAKPQFKKGCGGIDAFLGGFSFLKPGLLVEKMQRIGGPAAAAFAWDIAFNTLCAQCSDSVKSLGAMIDRLNQLQLDDCKAQKALVAITKDTTGIGGAAETEAVADFLQSSGVEDLWQNIAEDGNGSTPENVALSNGITKPQMIAGCPQEIRRTFFQPGSLLQNLAREKGMGQAYVELIRAIIGDVRISSALDFNYIPPCDQNADMDMSDIMVGDVYIREIATEDCKKISQITIGGINYLSIHDYVRRMLISITQRSINKTPLTSQEINFIQTLPSFIYQGIQNEIMYLGEDATTGIIADIYDDISSYLYTHAVMRDLFYTFTNIINTAQTIGKNKLGTDSGTGQTNCQLSLKKVAQDELFKMRDQIREAQVLLQTQYERQNDLFLANTQLMQEQRSRSEALAHQTLNDIIKDEQ